MKTLLAAVLLGAISLPAAASDLDYSYLDLAYSKATSTTSADILQDGKGYRVGGGYSLGEHFFLEGAYQRDTFDFQHVVTPFGVPSYTAQYLRTGFGYRLPVSERIDLVTHLDYGHARTAFGDGPFKNSFSDNGYVVGVSVRAQVVAGLELDAGLDHDDMGFGDKPLRCGIFSCTAVGYVRQNGSENVLSAAARYRFIPAFGVGLEYRHSSYDGWRELLLSARWNF